MARCPLVCNCPENLTCTLGTTLDTCDCGCNVCIQDIDTECDGFRPCDTRKNLTCDYQGDSMSEQGVCKDTEEDFTPVLDSPSCNPATEWTPCSKTCGFGNSIRITYEEETCIPNAERRLCMIRPCKGQYTRANYTVLKPTNACSRAVRWSQPLHLRFRDCLSRHPLLPRFCGHCSDGRLCSPSVTETRPVAFQCAQLDRKVIRQVMWVRRCTCGGKRSKKDKGKKKMEERAMTLGKADTDESEEADEV
ncbi:PREDICTED: protein NOV homolog [Nanorana parkeri]|uniref:protein NOV homolog n=1 Tax=Nanorana parkeri TaxID=125878 RepID=UPI00085475F5|nr:PREDICTED: protein NOV homolog [Nanorana parkeri]